MPHQRGHRHVSRRIPFPLLRRQEPAMARPFFRQDRPLGATGLSRSAQRKFPEPCAWIWSLASIFPRPSEGAKLAAVRRPHVSKLGANSESLGAVGVPIVVLEPSCASVFRDELRGLFPKDPRAARLREQTFLLSEFLHCHAGGYKPPALNRKVLLHGHCHHKALMTLSHEEALLRSMGVELESLDSGCCGMAGAFGLERENYPTSGAIGERG